VHRMRTVSMMATTRSVSGTPIAAVRLYDELDYAVAKLNQFEHELKQQPNRNQRELRLAGHVAAAVRHLTDARAALFRASQES
jgi:hypothetical protein